MDEEYKNYLHNSSKYEVSDEYQKIVDTLITNYPAYHRSTATGSIRKVNIADTLNSTELGTDVAARLRSLDIKVKER